MQPTRHWIQAHIPAVSSLFRPVAGSPHRPLLPLRTAGSFSAVFSNPAGKRPVLSPPRSMVSELLKAIWTYIKRRGSLLSMTLMYSFTVVPMQMWGGIANHRDGGYFSDPLGKASLLAYWQGLAEFSCGSLFLLRRRPADRAFAAVEDSDDGVVVVDKGSYLEFTPPEQQQELDAAGEADQPLVGVVILPGMFIPPLAYAPLASTMAQKGHPSHVVRFDFDLALDGWERIGEIIPPLATTTADDNDAATAASAAEQSGEVEDCPVARPTPTKWVLVGHSMGARAIAEFYPENSARVHGVVYLGAGNRINDALAGADVPAMLMRGSRDSLTPPEELEKAAHRLPKDTETVVVEGGNHRNFAHYTRQALDWEATITPQEQQEIVVDALVDFIRRRVVAGAPSTASTSP